jgi:cyclopropane-fatty-acyl-phospholipid synthase
MQSASDHAWRTKIFNDLFRDFHETSFAVRSADGWTWFSSPDKTPECTLIFQNAAAWQALMEDPTERTLGEAYIHGDLDIEGDLFAVFPIVHYILDHPAGSRHHILRALWRGSADFSRLLRYGRRHSEKRDQAAISYHYDLPIDFYRPWLGPTLAYSCAYFREPSESLEMAQTNKLELICRKLALRSEDRFLDIGCGWGSLLLHAASQHGARAYGITLSKEQAAIASSRIAHADLADRCSVELRDYRKMPELPTRFNKIASVGMFEHVGLKNLHDYFTIALRMLDPDGMFLNHGIARSATSPPAKDSFIDKYVFPDGELVPLGQVLETAESVGFEVRDVDNLRSHYERTLRLWVENLQSNARAVLECVSQQTYRIWLLYMAGSADAFRLGNIELYQVLLGRRPSKPFPTLSTREKWYSGWSTASSKATVA